MAPEAELRETEAGLVSAGVGWFVMNARRTLVLEARSRRQLAPDRVR